MINYVSTVFAFIGYFGYNTKYIALEYTSVGNSQINNHITTTLIANRFLVQNHGNNCPPKFDHDANRGMVPLMVQVPTNAATARSVTQLSCSS